MAYNTIFLSIRMKLDDVVSDINNQTKILENLRYCRRMTGNSFKVIFWNENLSEEKVKKFIYDSKGLLFEVNTTITKKFENCWFLLNTNETDKSNRRYEYRGEILDGIVQYMELVKHIKLKEKDSL